MLWTGYLDILMILYCLHWDLSPFIFFRWGICFNFSSHRRIKSDTCRVVNFGFLNHQHRVVGGSSPEMAWHFREFRLVQHYQVDPTVQSGDVEIVQFTKMWHTAMFDVFFDAKSQLFRNPQFRGVLGNHMCLPKSSCHETRRNGGNFGRQISKFASGWICTAKLSKVW